MKCIDSRIDLRKKDLEILEGTKERIMMELITNGVTSVDTNGNN